MSDTARATDLDPYGRIDTAGKGVRFYPQTRGTVSGGVRSSAYRAGKRIASPAKTKKTITP